MSVGWSVDPDGVAGVLAAVERAGQPWEADTRASRQLVDQGQRLVAGGRRALLAAWHEYMEPRSRVPGQAMHVVLSAAERVVEGTTVILAGDAEVAAQWRTENMTLLQPTHGPMREGV